MPPIHAADPGAVARHAPLARVGRGGRRVVTTGGAGTPPRPADRRHTGTIASGLAAIHCHGGGGASFADRPDARSDRSGDHRRAGTTTTVASLVTAALADLERQCADLAPLVLCGELAGSTSKVPG